MKEKEKKEKDPCERPGCACGSKLQLLCPDYWRCVCGKTIPHSDEYRKRLAGIQEDKKRDHEAAAWTPLDYSVRGKEESTANVDPAIRQALLDALASL